MYTAEEKRWAVELFIQYDMSCMAVINELGYPCRGSLYAWCEEYKRTGAIERRSMERYTEEQKRAAVEHYVAHGRCNARTRRALGYPSSTEYLAAWIDEYAPGKRKVRRPSGSYTDEDRKEAVIDCFRYFETYGFGIVVFQFWQ